jgi:molecular chaperone DnaJ
LLAGPRPGPNCAGAGKVIDNPCPECRGSGRIKGKKSISLKIPAGVETGSRLKLSNEGEAGAQGGPPGDLYVVISVREHPIFQREGQDVICEIPISFVQAALGYELEVPTLDGKIKLKIPAGTQSGKVLKLSGKGIPVLQGYGRGDQLVVVRVETPTQLTGRQKALLEEFARIKSGDVVLRTRLADGRPGRQVRLRCVTSADKYQWVFLSRLGLTLPERLREVEVIAQPNPPPSPPDKM